MAKDKAGYEQLDMFPVTPQINGLGITKFEISGASVKAQIEGVTNSNDIALLDKLCWQGAATAWVLSLHDGDVDAAIISVKKAYVDFINRTGQSHRPTSNSFEDAVNEAVNRAMDEKVVNAVTDLAVVG